MEKCQGSRGDEAKGIFLYHDAKPRKAAFTGGALRGSLRSSGEQGKHACPYGSWKALVDAMNERIVGVVVTAKESGSK